MPCSHQHRNMFRANTLRVNMFTISSLTLFVNFKTRFTPGYVIYTGISLHKIFIITHEPKQIELLYDFVVHSHLSSSSRTKSDALLNKETTIILS